MEVVFRNKRDQRAFSTHDSLQARWGTEGANKIARRLQQLSAAPTVAVMRALPGRCHELAGQRNGQLAVDVHHAYRLLFRPTTDPPPTKPDGDLDWGAVDSVMIIGIVDYQRGRDQQ